MAFDGLRWAETDAPAPLDLTTARAAAAQAERAWRETFEPGEDPYGEEPPASFHPNRAAARERFRRAHAAYVALLDDPEDVPTARAA